MKCGTVLICPPIQDWPSGFRAWIERKYVENVLAEFYGEEAKAHKLLATYLGRTIDGVIIRYGATVHDIWPIAMREFEREIAAARTAGPTDVTAELHYD